MLLEIFERRVDMPVVGHPLEQVDDRRAGALNRIARNRELLRDRIGGEAWRVISASRRVPSARCSPTFNVLFGGPLSNLPYTNIRVARSDDEAGLLFSSSAMASSIGLPSTLRINIPGSTPARVAFESGLTLVTTVFPSTSSTLKPEVTPCCFL